MADFCKTCSIDMFGKDFGDLAYGEPCPPGYSYTRICEGCGFIQTDHLGNCLVCDLKRGQPGHDTKRAELETYMEDEAGEG